MLWTELVVFFLLVFSILLSYVVYQVTINWISGNVMFQLWRATHYLLGSGKGGVMRAQRLIPVRGLPDSLIRPWFLYSCTHSLGTWVFIKPNSCPGVAYTTFQPLLCVSIVYRNEASGGCRMGQVVVFLLRHTGGMLRATGYSLFSDCRFARQHWFAAAPTDITDSSFLSLCRFSLFLHFAVLVSCPNNLKAHAQFYRHTTWGCICMWFPAIGDIYFVIFHTSTNYINTTALVHYMTYSFRARVIKAVPKHELYAALRNKLPFGAKRTSVCPAMRFFFLQSWWEKKWREASKYWCTFCSLSASVHLDPQ